MQYRSNGRCNESTRGCTLVGFTMGATTLNLFTHLLGRAPPVFIQQHSSMDYKFLLFLYSQPSFRCSGPASQASFRCSGPATSQDNEIIRTSSDNIPTGSQEYNPQIFPCYQICAEFIFMTF